MLLKAHSHHKTKTDWWKRPEESAGTVLTMSARVTTNYGKGLTNRENERDGHLTDADGVPTVSSWRTLPRPRLSTLRRVPLCKRARLAQIGLLEWWRGVPRCWVRPKLEIATPLTPDQAATRDWLGAEDCFVCKWILPWHIGCSQRRGVRLNIWPAWEQAPQFLRQFALVLRV